MKLNRLFPVAALCVAVFGLCWASITLFGGREVAAAVWPANALTLAFVLRWAKTRREGALALGSAIVAMVGANAICGQPAALALGFPAADAVEIAMALWLFRDLRMPVSGGRNMGRFLVGGVFLAPAAGAVVAGTVMALAAVPDLPAALTRWMLAEGLSMAVVAPLAVSLKLSHLRRDRPTLTISIVAQLIVLLGAVLVFAQPYPMLFLMFPLVMLAVFADRDVGGTVAVAITALVAVGATMLGFGPVAQAPNGVYLAQAMIAALVMTIQPVTAILRRLDAYTTVLDRERARAVALSDTKTRFLAHVSHEIRSPLSGVVTLAELMASGALGVLTARQREMLERIATSGAEIDALSRDLIDTAAIQAGKAKTVLADVCVHEAVAAAVETARLRMRDHRPNFVIAGVSRSEFVRADAGRLRQALVNLLVNAVKYGGRPPVVQVDLVEADGRLRIVVSDNGAGVSPENREAVFGDFDRADAEGSDVEGWGVGLTLSRELVRLQGGELGVSDGVLGGAAFWIELPRASLSAAA